MAVGIYDINYSLDDRFDHNITNSTALLIWAHGQVIGQYRPTIPAAAAGRQSYLLTDFYRPLELKYHGVNRGRWSDNLIDPTPLVSAGPCSAQRLCIDGSGACYSARWGTINGDTTKVYFELTTKFGGNKWVGIGFSENKQMPMTDIVTGFVRNGQASIQDRYASQQARPPLDDDQSQLADQCGSSSDDEVVIGFSRSVETSDSSDLALDQALFFLFAWGDVDVDQITQHAGDGKFVSDSRIDATKCVLSTGKG